MIFMPDLPFQRHKRGLFCNNPSFEMVQYVGKYPSTEDLRPRKTQKKRDQRRNRTDPDTRSLETLLKGLEIGKFSSPEKNGCSPVPAPLVSSSVPSGKHQERHGQVEIPLIMVTRWW